MSILEGIRLALRAIWVHKMRSGLTLLANVVAVMSVSSDEAPAPCQARAGERHRPRLRR